MYFNHGFYQDQGWGVILNFTESCCHFIERSTVDYEYIECNICFNVEAVMTADLLKEQPLHISCVEIL